MRLRLLVVMLLVTMLPIVHAPVASADGPIVRTAGPYEISASYAVVPPYVEEGNALVLRVRDTRTGDPVTGLENALSVQGTVTVLGVDRTYPVPLRRSLDQPGAYEGVFVPPAIGKYTFQVDGSIEGLRISEQFTSGEGGLPEVIHRTQGKYDEPGVYLALAIALAYVIGLAAILGVAAARKLRRTPTAV